MRQQRFLAQYRFTRDTESLQKNASARDSGGYSLVSYCVLSLVIQAMEISGLKVAW